MKTRHLISMLLIMLAGCAALGTYLTWQYQMPARMIARVDDAGISQDELSLRLRGLLWRQGRQWDQLSREEQSSLQLEASEALIDALLIKKWAAAHPAPATGAQTEADFQQFLKQFESPDGWSKRAAMQGLNEPHLREMLAGETRQRTALEAYLASIPPVSTEEVQSWFNVHQQELLIPECVQASHIFLSSHDKSKPDRTAEIHLIYQQVMSDPAAFPGLAGKFSEDERSKLKGGNLGWFTRERVPKEFAEKVFALPVDQVSPPFPSALGWHIARVQERRPPRLPQFIEVQPEITALLEDRKREAHLQKLMHGLRQKAQIVRNGKLIHLTNPPVQTASLH